MQNFRQICTFIPKCNPRRLLPFASILSIFVPAPLASAFGTLTKLPIFSASSILLLSSLIPRPTESHLFPLLTDDRSSRAAAPTDRPTDRDRRDARSRPFKALGFFPWVGGGGDRQGFRRLSPSRSGSLPRSISH